MGAGILQLVMRHTHTSFNGIRAETAEAEFEDLHVVKRNEKERTNHLIRQFIQVLTRGHRTTYGI